MKVPKAISKLLENKYVLYVVFALALISLFGYMMMGNTTAIVVFILFGFLVSNFSKNMIIILLIPLILTSLFVMGYKAKEGLENAPPTPPAAAASPATATATAPAAPTANTLTAMATNVASALNKATPTAATPAASPAPAPTAASSTLPSSKCVDGKDPEGKPCTAGESMTTMYKGSNRLDYASTVEDAYADLDKILGGDGIKNLTSDTQRLMEQQTQLANAMKGMGPLLEQAKGMLQGFDMKNLDGLASMAKNFGSSQ